jgi:O-antigen/teichoic acid export membrane protein
MNARRTVWSYQDTSLGESFLWSLAVTALPVASGFVISWVIARWAGPVVIGTVSWVMSFATMLEIPAKFGMDLSGSQLASELGVKSPGRLRGLFRTAIGLRLVFTAAVSVLTLLFAPAIARFFKDPALTVPIRVGAGVLFCVSLYEFQENFLIGLNRLRTVYKIRSLHLSLRIVFTSALVILGARAIGILSGYCAAWIIVIAIFGILLHRCLPASDPSPQAGGHTGRLMRLSLALTVSSASVILYSHMDRLILGYFSGVSEVGQYTVARNIAEVSLFPVFAAMMMLRPALAARYSVGRVGESARIIGRTLQYTFASGVWFCALFVTLGVPLVTLVFSETFRYAGQLLVWFVGVIAFRSVGAVILPALVAAGRARLYAYLTMSSAAIYFLASIFLIPRLESRGAILATFGSYGVLMVIGLTKVFRIYGIHVGWRSWSIPVRTILAGAVASGATWWASEHSPLTVPVLPGALLVTVIYLFLIFIFRVGTMSDLRRLRGNLKESKE